MVQTVAVVVRNNEQTVVFGSKCGGPDAGGGPRSKACHKVVMVAVVR